VVADKGQRSEEEKIPAAVATVSVVPASIEMTTAIGPAACEVASAVEPSPAEVASAAVKPMAAETAPSSAEPSTASANFCHGALRITDASEASRRRPHRFMNTR
jgi:hypothetical protein